MANIKPRELTDVYLSSKVARNRMRETGDCAVLAVSIVTDLSYEHVRQVMEKHGRKRHEDTGWGTLTRALRELGWDWNSIRLRDFLDSYPGRAALHKHVTSHHPDRYPDFWQNGKRYLMVTRGHVLAVLDGVVHDWSRNHSRRAIALLEVWPTAEMECRQAA